LRNRFENYISNGYTQQFTPTPLDANMAFNTINARQAYYDNIQKALATANPQLDYLTPNQYDQGDMMIANQLHAERQQGINEIADQIAKTDNLTEAARNISKFANDPEYNKKVQGLQNRKLQDQQNRKMLQDTYGKDPFYNQYLSNYERSRYSEFSPTSSLNSPIGALTPDLDKKIKTIADMMESNSFTTADGSMIGTTGDGQFYVTRKGKKEYISQQEAFNEMSAFVLGDPEVGNWYNTLLQTGYKKEDLDAMLTSKIGGAASAKAFTKTESEIGYMEDGFARDANKKKLDTPSEPVFNPWGSFNSQSRQLANIDENGNIVPNWNSIYEEPEFKQIQEAFAKETKIYNANETSEQRNARIQTASNKVTATVKKLFDDKIALIKSNYPDMFLFKTLMVEK
jgi:hypothetical protein